MRYVSFQVGGRATFGIAHEAGLVDLGARLGDQVADLRMLLDAFATGFELPHIGTVADYAPDEVTYLPVCTPRKLLCIGLNYEEHRKETGREVVAHPTIFGRFADTLVGHNQPIVRPRASTDLDFEGELAVVIGRHAHQVPQERALEYVAGYTCFNDGSIRDWQRHTSQFLPGKNFPSTAPLGPALVTPDEVGPLRDLRIESRLNGVVMQQATLGEMIFPVDALIAYISAFTPLSPGDVIATGTPAGVGWKRVPSLYMTPGDTIEVIIERVGHLRNGVVDEAARG